MVIVTPALPALSGDLALFHTTDPLLSNSPVLVFYGPAPSISSTTSRIQVHVFTPAGLESYTRLAISPNSPYYAAVKALPREEQGDEVCRGLAFGLSKYFAEIPKTARDAWTAQACTAKKAPSAFALFTDAHVAILASRMNRIENAEEILDDIQRALGEQSISWLDTDVVLPPRSIHLVKPDEDDALAQALDEDDLCARRYGHYASFIKMLGEPAFLPTSKLKRAPSKPTAVGRSQAFLHDQREMARKEMAELVDTEANYVSKLDTLVNGVGGDLRSSAADNAVPVSSPVERMVNELFPRTLDKMLEINSAFLAAVRQVLHDTDEAAQADIQNDTDETSQDVIADSIGLTDFARCLVDWFPHFAHHYPQYIRSHARFPRLMRRINRHADPLLLNKFHDVGEKRLVSLLIEPVQRLPRYTLYIDSIAKQLPVAHPALKPLLRARDIISEICSSDAPGMRETDVLVRLQRLVASWPEEIENLGRLLTITDVAELLPPYEPTECRGPSGVLLLFTDCTIFLEKRGENAMSGRALLAELGKPLIDDRRDSGQMNFTPSLHFVDAFNLEDTTITEYMNHRAINLLPTTGLATEQGIIPEHRVYLLEGAYAGKASKFQEEWTKAQVEGRFSEEERESGKWEVRSAHGAAGELNLFNAIFEQQSDIGVDSAKVRIVIDPAKHEHRVKVGENGVEAIVSMTGLGDGFWQITTESGMTTTTRDKVTEGEFLPVLMRRLTGLLQFRFSSRNSAIVTALVLRNQQIIDDLNLQFQQADGIQSLVPAGLQHRPRSPVKLISNFLEHRHHQSPSPRKLQPAPVSLADPPVLRPSQYSPKPPSRDSNRPTSKDSSSQRPGSAPDPVTAPSNPFKRLEETLSTYILALQARKGNIVGKIVQARSRANELSVNELYNSLLEDPNMMVVAAQSSIDVLFAAFEKFVKVAWKDQAGPVISVLQLLDIQAKAESMFPVDFENYFKTTFHSMTAPNQRALRNIIRLLAELLDGTGNDGDRGMLTAAFTEMLVTEGDPYAFVSLVDRFVEDIESLFGEVVGIRDIQPPTSKPNSFTRHSRSRSVNTSSLTSNTSSLRKKFGFSTLGRENSKSEQESKVGSVLRALSKTSRLPDHPPAMTRGTLHRAKSSETDVLTTPVRPNSMQDRAVAFASTLESRPRSQDASSILTHGSSPGGLVSIAEAVSPKTSSIPKKKRRSSLSDLKSLEMAIGESPFISPSTMRRFNSVQPEDRNHDSPTPKPSITNPSDTPSKSSNSQRSRLPSTFRKENSPQLERANSTVALSRGMDTLQEESQAQPELGHFRPRSFSKAQDEVTITAYGSVRRGSVQSGIPTRPKTPVKLRERPSTSSGTPKPLRLGLSERPTSGNAMKIRSPPPLKPSAFGSVTSPPSSTRKLRMQSPQKLRERLQDEHKTLSSAHSSLQEELGRIGEELSATMPLGRRGSVRDIGLMAAPPLSSGGRPTIGRSRTDSNASLDPATRLQFFEHNFNTLFQNLQDRIGALSTDISSSLTVSETRARKLDELYREANAENEALYAKVNEELAKVLKGVRGGDGVDELKRKLKESQEEEGRLRRENARLKREVLGLRSQLRE